MPRKRPLLITVGIFGSLLTPISFIVFMLFIMFGPELSSYTINEQQVSREVFQKFYLSVMLPSFVPSNVILVIIAYGFWKEKTWARHLAMVSWLLGGVILIFLGKFTGPGGLVFSLLGTTIIPMSIAYWYFYKKTNVVAYYQEIAK